LSWIAKSTIELEAITKYQERSPNRVRIAETSHEVVDFESVHKAVAAGDDEGDPPPGVADDGRQLVFEGAELKRIVPIASPRVVWLGGEQVAACHQFVAFDRGVVAKWPSDSRRRFWWSRRPAS
jgi:hypothetical protein